MWDYVAPGFHLWRSGAPAAENELGTPNPLERRVTRTYPSRTSALLSRLPELPPYTEEHDCRDHGENQKEGLDSTPCRRFIQRILYF